MLTKYQGPGPAVTGDDGPVSGAPKRAQSRALSQLSALRPCLVVPELTVKTDGVTDWALSMTSRHSSVSSQLLTVLAVSFGPFSVGLSKGYSSPALASLATSGHLGVTEQQSSWLASLSLLGALLGGLLSSLVLRAGRKNSLLLVSLPFSASWMLTVFATNVEMMFCTAFTAGLCSAIIIVVSQVREDLETRKLNIRLE